MHEAGTQQALGKEIAHQSRPTDRAWCRYCGSDQVYRLYRQGFWQVRIFPLFGFYPWRCKVCSAEMMLHKRRLKKRSTHAE